MAAKITAVVQNTTPPRVLVTVTGLAGATAAQVYRVTGDATRSGGVRSLLRPAPLPPPLTTAVLVDGEVPYGRDVSYVVSVVRAGATTDEASAGPVRVPAPGGLPMVSDPVTGTGVSVTVVSWPELEYGGRVAVVAVAGRRRPITESDVLLAPSSTVTLWAPDQPTLAGLRALLATGQVVLLRATCDGVEDTYLQPMQVKESRRGDPGRGWARLVDIEAQETDAPAVQLAATGDTLSDLAAYVPSTLADLAARFPGTLLDVATTQLSDL